MSAPPGPMKVLLTTDTVGGVWTFGLELAAQLVRREVEVVLAALGGLPDGAQTAQAARIPGLRMFTSDARLEWMDDPWRDVERSRAWVLEIARRTRPDVIHLNTFAHGDLPWHAPVLLTAHSCVLSWWEAVKGEPAPAADWAAYRACVAASLRAADLVTAPTAALLSRIEALYGALPRASVVPNGCAAACHRPAGRKEPLVLAAGRLWDDAKNVAAVARVATRLPWPVYAAGECHAPDGGMFEAGGLRLLGKLSAPEMAAWMARASLFVSPARYEPFGLGILEAALSGCALVLGDIPSLREVWPEGALFVPPDDDRALAAALETLIADPARRRALADAARRRALEFSAERMAERYLDLYRTLASGGEMLGAA